MDLLSCEPNDRWKVLDIRAYPDTASECGRLDISLLCNYRAVVRHVHGYIVEELSTTLPFSYHSLPLPQMIPCSCGTILKFLDEKWGMDPVARQDLFSKILDALKSSVRVDVTKGFCVAVNLELTTSSEQVIGDDHDLPPHRASEAARQKLDAASFVPAAVGEMAGTCAICLEDLSSGRDNNQRLTKMPCAHVFHNPCVFRWLDTSSTCPICRQELDD